MPSCRSFGVEVSLSNAPDFCPCRGGARSPGIVSAAPGGGICFIGESAVIGDKMCESIWIREGSDWVRNKTMRRTGALPELGLITRPGTTL